MGLVFVRRRKNQHGALDLQTRFSGSCECTCRLWWRLSRHTRKAGGDRSDQDECQNKPKIDVNEPRHSSRSFGYGNEDFDIGGCTGGKLRKEGINAGDFFNEEFLRTYNTRERLDTHKKVDALTGMIVRNVKDTTIVCPYTR